MKKWVFIIISVITTSLITYSCKSDVCENQESLFVIKNSTLPIPYDSLGSIRQCLEYLETTYCYEGETAQPTIFFDTKKGQIVSSAARNVLAIGLEPTPCTGELEYNFNQILEINLDGNNVLIEGKRMPLDSIGQYIYYQYLNYGQRKGFSSSPQGNGIWLISEMNRPLSDLNAIINQVVKGYLETVDFYTDTFFGKKVCELNHEELVKLKSKLQFHLAIKYSDDVKSLLQIGF